MIIEDNIKGIPYAPPQMTTIPLRPTGAMLIGSVTPTRKIGTMDYKDGGFYYQGQDGGRNNTATEWTNEGNSEDWGSGFF